MHTPSFQQMMRFNVLFSSCITYRNARFNNIAAIFSVFAVTIQDKHNLPVYLSVIQSVFIRSAYAAAQAAPVQFANYCCTMCEPKFVIHLLTDIRKNVNIVIIRRSHGTFSRKWRRSERNNDLHVNYILQCIATTWCRRQIGEVRKVKVRSTKIPLFR